MEQQIDVFLSPSLSSSLFLKSIKNLFKKHIRGRKIGILLRAILMNTDVYYEILIYYIEVFSSFFMGSVWFLSLSHFWIIVINIEVDTSGVRLQEK